MQHGRWTLVFSRYHFFWFGLCQAWIPRCFHKTDTLCGLDPIEFPLILPPRQFFGQYFTFSFQYIFLTIMYHLLCAKSDVGLQLEIQIWSKFNFHCWIHFYAIQRKENVFQSISLLYLIVGKKKILNCLKLLLVKNPEILWSNKVFEECTKKITFKLIRTSEVTI